MVFGPKRDPVHLAQRFMEFFCHESCGHCTPCRVGNHLMRKKLESILAGRGVPEDLDYLMELADTIKSTSRCGLGQTSPNCVVSAIKNFREAFERHLERNEHRDSVFRPTFDPLREVSQASAITGRSSELF